MFESQANKVNIKDIKLDILQMVIDFSYSGEILLTQASFNIVLQLNYIETSMEV